MSWLLLVLSLPTENATARMRAWRALKACGAAVLRDGVHLLPARDGHEPMLSAIADDVRDNGGSAELLSLAEPADRFVARFDRTAEFGALLERARALRHGLDADNAAEALKQGARLRKAFDALAAIDFFPGEAQVQAAAAIDELDAAARRCLAPDEPHAVARAVKQKRAADFHGRVWATRRRPWVDRLASAWLIRRFIDRKARFLWLASPKDCPKSAVGFDFDGATFSHVGAKVTFETLLASFALEQPALVRIGAIVHHLDAGGVPAPESAGVERVLAGLRDSIGDDDKLLAAALPVFDALLAAFDAEAAAR
jgi:hypothetical protein